MIEDSSAFCTYCGNAFPQQSVPNDPNPGYTQQPMNGFDAQQDMEQNKVMALLSYFGILILVPFFCAKQSPYVRFHMNQGLVLLIASVITEVFASWIPLVGLLTLAILVLRIIGIVRAYKCNTEPLPLVGTFKILK